MKFKNNVFICFFLISSFIAFLRCNEQIFLGDLQVKNDASENAFVLISVLDQLTKAHEKYPSKDTSELKIKCKNCVTRELSLYEFEGGLIGWALKSLGSDDEEFEKIKMLLESWIKLLSDEVLSSEILDFMLTVSNDMKQVCSNCHGVVWEKVI
ncbi:MAG: hypothetical protein ABIA74_00475 [bacterium]